MKHGFVILSKDEILGEISFGSFPTLREAKKAFKWIEASINVGAYEKKHLRLVELVEREILVDK